jgi:arabinofuranosyltransferase
MAASLVFLLGHSWVYRFSTDDAFISFRYARNFAEGHGLVFNPGLERVEGYSNFLWVLLLGAFHRLGAPIEPTALALSLAATAALWVLVARETLRIPPGQGRAALVLIPCWALAITRSVAVWSSSGLETRLFETLLVAGALRLNTEIEALDRGETRRPWAAVLLGFATWTRADGMLLAGMAIAVAALYLLWRRRLPIQRIAVQVAPFIVLVAFQFGFRLAYYGEWLPNTYYAKLDGRTAWGVGWVYLGSFLLEYATYLWIPLIVLAARQLAAERRSFLLLLIGGMMLSHLLYVVAIGGDHFEYRPLDVVFPFAFLLLYHGARRLAATTRGARILCAYTVALAIGLWQIPFQSHRQFVDHYLAGFPGRRLNRPEAKEYLSPDRDPITRLPGFRQIAQAHRRLLIRSTSNFAGIRREEHRHFLATVRPLGRVLRQMIAAGVLPPDFYVALPCVGVIPFDSGIRTLDQHGLTDAHVAHSEFQGRETLGHDKMASLEYARSRGVDLWCGTHPVGRLASDDFHKLLRRSSMGEGSGVAAEIAPGLYLLGEPPGGIEQLARRAPRLNFVDVKVLGKGLVDGWIAQYRERVQRAPNDDFTRLQLAILLGDRGQASEALALAEPVVARLPNDPEAWIQLGWLRAGAGKQNEARAAYERALSSARARGQLDVLARAERMLAKLSTSTAAPTLTPPGRDPAAPPPPAP